MENKTCEATMDIMKPVKAKLITHGGYDGLKHLTFPIEVSGYVHPYLGYIDVPMNELERIGYNKQAGQVADIPDCSAESMDLTFFQGSEAVIIG